MVKIKVLKELVRTVPDIKNAVMEYMITGSFKLITNDSDYAEYEAFGVDNSILTLYKSVTSSTIDEIVGVVEIPIADLDSKWSEKIVDEVVVDVLIKDAFPYITKGDKALLTIAYKTSGLAKLADDAMLRKLIGLYPVADFYCIYDMQKRKVQGYSLDKAEILAMTKDNLKVWMVERGLDKKMANFDTALKSDLQTFVIEYYYL